MNNANETIQAALVKFHKAKEIATERENDDEHALTLSEEDAELNDFTNLSAGDWHTYEGRNITVLSVKSGDEGDLIVTFVYGSFVR